MVQHIFQSHWYHGNVNNTNALTIVFLYTLQSLMKPIKVPFEATKYCSSICCIFFHCIKLAIFIYYFGRINLFQWAVALTITTSKIVKQRQYFNWGLNGLKTLIDPKLVPVGDNNKKVIHFTEIENYVILIYKIFSHSLT